jgi:hypothetical protein
MEVMKFQIYCVVTMFTALAFNAIAQDPTKVAPDSYKLQFENDYVKVLRVTYAPRSKVPTHDHSKGPAAYVYLVDSGPVRFVHDGWEHPVLTRPATKAGSFRLSPTRFDNETHAVENNSDTRSEFLRIELLTEAPDRQSLNARIGPFTGDRGNGLNKVEFENSQLRVTRLISKPRTPLNLIANPGEHALLVVLSFGGIGIGDTAWLSPKETKTFSASGTALIEILRFDFKTKPKKM